MASKKAKNGPQPAELQKLQRIWAKKLEESGFQDIEDPKGNLKRFHSRDVPYTLKHEPQRVRDTQRYYELAEHLLTEDVFERPIDRQIWTMHAAGTGMPQIAKAVNCSLGKVHKIISSLREHLNLGEFRGRSYSPRKRD